jgi:hypothetical protein
MSIWSKFLDISLGVPIDGLRQFKYAEQKKAAEAKSKQKVIEIEIKFRLLTVATTTSSCGIGGLEDGTSAR